MAGPDLTGGAPRADPRLDGPQDGRGLLGAFADAARGLLGAALCERNFRIQLVAAVLLGALASALPLAIAEELALLLCAAIVLAAEVANSALEALVDLVTRERDERARHAKDAAAGAVLVLAVASVLVLVAVLLRHAGELASGAALRHAALGVPLAGAAAALAWAWARPRAVDLALAALGGAMVIALAASARAPALVALAALAFALCAGAASARRRVPRSSDTSALDGP